MFVEPILTSEDSSILLKQRMGHLVLVFSFVSFVYFIVSPTEDGMFKNGFLVETRFKRTQEPYREPDPGPVAYTDADELNNLFSSAALPVIPSPSITVNESVPEVNPKQEQAKKEVKGLKGTKITQTKPKPIENLKNTDSMKVNERKEIVIKTPEEVLTVQKPVTESLLDRIRKDPNRIYVDEEFTVGDLSWAFRNATDFGIEFLISSRNEALKTYYFPKASVDGYETIMEGSVLAPGQRIFGVIPYTGLKNKDELRITLQSGGGVDKKVKVKLSW